MARVLVTGASGFIGRHLVDHLQGLGDEVRGLVRGEAGLPAGVEVARGEITDRPSLDRAVAGVEVVYHLAGRTLSLSAGESRRVNAGGTAHLAAACAARASPPTLVFVSSLAAAGPSIGERPRVESDPPAPVSDYGRSKRAGEVALGAFAGSVPITVFRPPGVFGPGDRNLLALFRSVKRGWNVVPVRAPLRMSFVHVADLAGVLAEGARRGTRLEPGGDLSQGCYFVGFDEHPTYAGLGELIGEALGRSGLTTARLPSAFGFAAAGVSELVARLRRRPTLLSLDKMREAAAGSWTCDPARARRDLGFRPAKGLLERLREAARWYEAEGWL